MYPDKEVFRVPRGGRQQGPRGQVRIADREERVLFCTGENDTVKTGGGGLEFLGFEVTVQTHMYGIGVWIL